MKTIKILLRGLIFLMCVLIFAILIGLPARLADTTGNYSWLWGYTIFIFPAAYALGKLIEPYEHD
jgi:hypothetical protein